MTMTNVRDPFTMNGNIVTTRVTMAMEFLFGKRRSWPSHKPAQALSRWPNENQWSQCFLWMLNPQCLEKRKSSCVFVLNVRKPMLHLRCAASPVAQRVRNRVITNTKIIFVSWKKKLIKRIYKMYVLKQLKIYIKKGKNKITKNLKNKIKVKNNKKTL